MTMPIETPCFDAPVPSLPPPPLLPPPPPPPGPPITRAARPPLPELGVGTAGLMLLGAVLADIAMRRPTGSLAAALLGLTLVGLVGRCGRLSSTSARVAGGLAVVASLAVTVRSSPWVTWVEASAVCALLVLAAADGLRTDRGPTWRRSAVAAMSSAVAVPRWLAATVSRIPRVGVSRAGAALRAALIGGLVALVIVALLASGDAVFQALVASLGPGPSVGHLVVVACCSGPVAALALLALRSEVHPANVGPPPPARFRLESLTTRWVVAALLGVWCGVQVVVASGGARAVLAAQGLTAAEYARQGFFQLVAVAAFSLAVLNVSHRFLAVEPGGARIRRDRAALAPALGIGVTLVVLVLVTFNRLYYCMAAYGLTMLRLAVAAFLGWLAVMTLASVARAAGVGAGHSWLALTAVLSAGFLAAVYGWGNPAAWVAHVNIDRALSGADLDVGYLLELGPDAETVLAGADWAALGGQPPEVARRLCREPAPSSYGFLGWNRAMATTSCPG